MIENLMLAAVDVSGWLEKAKALFEETSKAIGPEFTLIAIGIAAIVLGILAIGVLWHFLFGFWGDRSLNRRVAVIERGQRDLEYEGYDPASLGSDIDDLREQVETLTKKLNSIKSLVPESLLENGGAGLKALVDGQLQAHLGSQPQQVMQILLAKFSEKVPKLVAEAADAELEHPSDTVCEQLAGTVRRILRDYIDDDNRVCIAAVSGTADRALPDTIRRQVDEFFAALPDWLKTDLEGTVRRLVRSRVQAPDETTIEAINQKVDASTVEWAEKQRGGIFSLGGTDVIEVLRGMALLALVRQLGTDSALQKQLAEHGLPELLAAFSGRRSGGDQEYVDSD